MVLAWEARRVRPGPERESGCGREEGASQPEASESGHRSDGRARAAQRRRSEIDFSPGQRRSLSDQEEPGDSERSVGKRRQGRAGSLTATLTSGGSPVSGKTIVFQVKGRTVGRAKTNTEGVATLAVARLKGVGVGNYPSGVTARYAGDASHKARSTKGKLTVSRFSTVLGGVSATGVYNGTGSLTATLFPEACRWRARTSSSGSWAAPWERPPPTQQGVATLATSASRGLRGQLRRRSSASFAGTSLSAEQRGGFHGLV